jgi:hypothetical protein
MTQWAHFIRGAALSQGTLRPAAAGYNPTPALDADKANSISFAINVREKH